MEAQTIEIQKELFDEKKSKMAKYRDLVIGGNSFLSLIKSQTVMWEMLIIHKTQRFIT